jgi:putative transposase
MNRSKFTEGQIIAILREQEAGGKTAEVCRRHGISGATFYAWKAKFGGMELSEAKRLKALEDENAKLKHLLRKAAECNKEAGWRRIGALIDQFTPQECENYIRNAGYGSA